MRLTAVDLVDPVHPANMEHLAHPAHLVNMVNMVNMASLAHPADPVDPVSKHFQRYLGSRRMCPNSKPVEKRRVRRECGEFQRDDPCAGHTVREHHMLRIMVT
jgi:bifunctional ADP-heptose synthase (sugar kinase/adenylyltransferase)